MCLICDRIDMIRSGTNPYFVKELKTGYVVIGDFQHFYGYHEKEPIWWYPLDKMYDKINKPNYAELEKMKQMLIFEPEKTDGRLY